ncbi:secreted protein containing Peptidase M43B, pregnancy-associated plasma-A domain protein, partial [gut metagenome]
MKLFIRTITWSALIILISCAFLVACSEENELEPTPAPKPNPESPTPALENYQLPIIFHVFYQDKTDNLQYIEEKQLKNVLKRVNNFYAGQTGSPQTNMNVQFYLAPKDENGKTLQTPGVDYIQMQNVEIDCEKFMSKENLPYQRYLWDPNQYINIFLYHFAKIQNGENQDEEILGISHLPYNVKNKNKLIGLKEVEQPYIGKENLKYIHCISLNSKYAYEETSEFYSPEDFAVTMAHELGHYLGLHHSFDENELGDMT